MDQWQYTPAKDLGLSQRLKSARRESGLVGLITRNLWWLVARGYFALFQRVKVEGLQNLPTDAPFILVANHCSHFDALLLACKLPLKLRNQVFPIAAGDSFFETPILRAFAAGAMNALPLWRRNAGHHAMDDLRQRLLTGPCGYILFPEGTRSRDGNMKPFKAGVGMLIAASSVPVIPCHIDGTHKALPADRRFPRTAKITLRIGKPLHFTDTPNHKDGWTHIAQALQSAVAKLAEKDSSDQTI